MDRRRKVELFEEMRREYRFGVWTIQGVAKKLNIHGRMVRQALASGGYPRDDRTAAPGPAARLEGATESVGCTDAAAVRHLLVAGALTHGEQPLPEIGLLQRYERLLPVLNDYDQLLGAVRL
jgi:hypothetical protein